MKELFASDAQASVILHGIRSNSGYDFIDLPTGAQQLPDWVKDAHVDWQEQYSNSPIVTLKTLQGVSHWDNEQWVREGDYWRCYHLDGRLQQHAKSGELTWFEGNVHRQPGWVTPQEQGYGSRWFEINAHPDYVPDASKGTRVYLCGPWHTGAKQGFVDVNFYEIPDVLNTWDVERPWYQRMAFFGLAVTEELFLKIITTYLPHVRVARVGRSYGQRIELVKPEWPAPKGFFYYENEYDIQRYHDKRMWQEIRLGDFNTEYDIRHPKKR